MKTQGALILAVVSVLAISLGQAEAQQPAAMAPSFAGMPAGSGVAPASFIGSCGACDGAGCGICGVAPSAGGFRLSNMHPGGMRAKKCGCGSSACGGGGCLSGGGGGMLQGGGIMQGGMMPGGGGCQACGGNCGGACGLGGMGGGLAGGLGGGLAGGLGQGHMIQAMQAMNASRHGGFSTQMLGQENGPFGGGGCCTPIWYDFSVEWLNLKRDESIRTIDTTSRNAGGGIVLSTDNLDLDNASGIRATYALLIGPSTNLEFTYFGAHNWDDQASVAGDGDLFSIFSRYGTDPIGQNGFPQTVDQADFHSLGYESELQNFELNGRRRWVSAGCLLHGSYLMGVRYLSLEEQMSHDTRVADGGFLDYDNISENDAVGFQVGGDIFVCISPRMKLGFELKGGVFGNDTSSQTTFNINEVDGAATTAFALSEDEGDTDAAFVGELGVSALFRVTPRLMIKGGYSLLYLDGFTTSAENFSSEYPLNADSTIAQIPLSNFNDASDVLYHGASLGVTWMW